MRAALWQPLLLVALVAWGSVHGEEERLIGWGGERERAIEAQVPSLNQSEWIETISWSPRAFLYHGFLSHEECDHLISLAQSRLERSQVVGKGSEAIDPIRTSYSASLEFGEDEVVASIEHRIARWTRLPMTHGEGIEVLRYKNGQKYDAHWDWFEEQDLGETSQRTATVLMYLAEVEPDAGGETALPLATALDENAQSIETGYSECASKQGISVRPLKGDVLLFWDQKPDGTTVDRAALHASCPTFKGQKWTATKWLHNQPYQGPEMVEVLNRKGFSEDPFHGGRMPPGWTKPTSYPSHMPATPSLLS